MRLCARFLVLPVFLLSGCGLVTTTVAPGSSVSPGSVQFGGSVHGGNQPVSGAKVQLWQVGTTGYGSAPAALGTSVTTGAGGSFSLGGVFTCPSASTLVYITATGGNPGLADGTNNDALAMMSVVGPCSSLTSSTFLNINEVTTVASVYALAQFMTASAGLGSYSSSTTGISNAFATVNNLVNTSAGSARSNTPYGNGIVPTAEINTLANILTPCVNSTGSASAPCSSLFAAATPSGGTSPGNTVAAALDIALNPGQNVTSLFNQSTANPAFQPVLSTVPNDWTMALSYASGGGQALSLAIDSLGDAWVSNAQSISFLSPLGVPAINGPFAVPAGPSSTGQSIAIDTSNNAWMTANSTSSVTEFDATYNGNNYTINSVSGPYTGIGLSSPSGIAIDGASNIWIANSSDSVVLLEASQGYNFQPFPASLNSPLGIAIDQAGNAWTANSGNGTIVRIVPNGSAVVPAGYTSGGISNPAALAIDSLQNVWSTDTTLSVVSEIGSNGAPLSPSGYSVGGLSNSYSDQIDGKGNIWVADYSQNRISGLTSAGAAISPTTGFQGGSLHAPHSLAIDGSGNVWVANLNPLSVNSKGQTVSEFIGLVAPVVTPLSVAVGQGRLGAVPATLPITINSSVLPPYTSAIPYNATVYASGGNSGNFTWSLASGSFPTGVSLSSSGVMSGTPSSNGNFTPVLKVCDAVYTSNCAMQTFAINSTGTALSALGKESALNGTYSFRLSGFRNIQPGSTAGALFGSAYTGSLTFNGSGSVTGELDIINNGAAAFSSGLSGSYQIGSNNMGYISIPIPASRPLLLSVSVGTFSSGVAQTIHMIEFDDTYDGTGFTAGVEAAGIGKLATSSSFTASTLDATFVFGFSGETACTNYNNYNNTCPQTITPFGPLTAAGYFTGSGTSLTGEEDVSAVGTSYSQVGLSGTFTAPDSFGRGTMTLATAASYPLPPITYVYYIVNSGEVFLMSSSQHLTSALLSGDALLQTPGIFSASNPNPLSGNLIGYAAGPYNGDGVSQIATQGSAGLFLISVLGTQLAVTSDQAGGGNVELNQTAGSGSYSVDAHGRVTFTGAPVVFYLANTSAGFGDYLSAGTSGNDPGLFYLVQQTGGPFSLASLSGTYAYADIPPGAFSDLSNGTFTANGSGSLTSLTNQAFNGGVLSPGQTDTFTYTVASNGRVVAQDINGNTTVAYIINPTTIAFFATSVTNPVPSLSFAQQ